MHVQTFMGKVGIETLRQMDDHINDWMQKNKIEPKIITQTFGNERHSHHHELEPVIITSIWY